MAASLLMSEPLAEDGSVLIVGGGLAALRCAQGLRDQGFNGSITMVGDEPHLPYDRPPLSKQVATGKWPVEKTNLVDDERRATLQVDFVLGTRAVHLDPERREITFDDGSKRVADRVVIATGATPRRLATGAGVVAHYVRTYEDGLQLASSLSGPPKRVVVVGAGFIGAEVASSARSLGHEVTVLETLAVPLSTVLGEELGSRCAALHERNGTTLLTGVTIESIEAGNRGTTRIALLDGTTHVADVLVIGIGVVPNTDWLNESGLELENGVVVDGALFATNTVMAIGDVARFAWTRLGATSLTRIEHWQVAADHGQFAATALLRGRAASPAIQLLPYFWSDQYGLKLQMLGRPELTDEVNIVLEEEDGKLLALFRRGEALSAVFAISKPKQLMGYRQLLLDGCLFDDALKLLNA